jgi:hypothetical protein
MTGGDLHICRGLKATLNTIKTLASKIGHQRVLLSFSHDANAPFHSKDCLAELTIKTVGNWPIPENFWHDRSNDTLPPRHAHPRLVYRALNPKNDQDGQLIVAYDNAKAIDFPMDLYEVRWLKSVNHGPSNAIKGQRYAFYAPLSGRQAGLGEPFGLMKHGKISGTFEFIVLPYDFATLIALAKQAHDISRTVPLTHVHAVLPQQFKTVSMCFFRQRALL